MIYHPSNTEYTLSIKIMTLASFDILDSVRFYVRQRKDTVNKNYITISYQYSNLLGKPEVLNLLPWRTQYSSVSKHK